MEFVGQGRTSLTFKDDCYYDYEHEQEYGDKALAGRQWSEAWPVRHNRINCT